MFDRTLTNADVRDALGITPTQAWRFLERYGVRMGRSFAISERKFKQMQQDGEAAQWMKEHIKYGHKVHGERCSAR